MMRKIIFVIRVDNYQPELCKITIPTIKFYSQRIGAEFKEITERKFFEFPPTYEKMQIYELGKGYDRVACIDADYMIHPQAPDLLSGMSDGYVGCLEAYDVRHQFKTKGTAFEKDGRYIGLATNFVVTTKETHDVWKPLKESWEKIKKEIKREFIADEYCVSLNLAERGYKFTGLNFSPNCQDWFVHLGVTTNVIDPKFVSRALIIQKHWQEKLGNKNT